MLREKMDVLLRLTTVIQIAVFISHAIPVSPALAESPSPPTFVGSQACEGCHQDEYKSFATYAKKSRSFQSIEKLKESLTPEEIDTCYSCHTTGYGQPGGFVDPERTPHLKNAGCEVCHGPGATHVTTQKPGDIKRNLTKKDCEKCHISERVKAFRYKPLVHGGAH